MLRGITYKLQERLLGGLSRSLLRKLEGVSVESEARSAHKPPPISLKAGTRLVREWRGVTHSVLVQAQGFEWNGRRYRSLTVVAQKITGAHWSGPRFFGLRQGGRSVEATEGEDDRPKASQIFRCAIYIRKSSDDGLEQEFNSLDAELAAM